MPKRSIELGEDLSFQRRQWRWQRTAWMIAGAIIGAGLLGLFGEGPLSSARAVSADGTLSVEYERFVRREAPSRIVVTAAPGTEDRSLDLHLDGSRMETMQIVSVEPTPQEALAGDGARQYRFGRLSTRAPARILYVVETAVPGLQQLRIGVGGGSEVSFWRFTFP
jgi:hypothetical protein